MDRHSKLYALSCALFPERCAICGDVIKAGYRYCTECREHSERITGKVCSFCGAKKADCVCKKHHRYYDDVRSLFYYTDALKQHFPRFKNEEHYSAAQTFAEDMATTLRCTNWTFDCITAVPSHPDQLKERGFDPAGLLAEALSKELDSPYVTLLYKMYATPPQKELSRLERTGNLLGAFDVTKAMNGRIKRVLLVDDVMTTGSTLNECSKMLKIYGAETVFVITVGNTCLRKQNDV